MAISKRKEREREEMRRRIMDAAMTLFVTQGYRSVTIRRIAESIEYSPGTIYLYFSSKDDIYLALLLEGFDRLYEKQKTVQLIADPMQRIIEHGRVYLDFALENRHYYDLMFIQPGPLIRLNKGGGNDSTENSYKLLKTNVIQCMEAGYFRDENPEVVAFTLWSLVHGAASHLLSVYLENVHAEARQALAEGFKDFMGRMLLQRGAGILAHTPKGT